MESFEDFDIHDPKYKKVEDLPRAVQPDFVNVVGDNGKTGFVQKSAEEETFSAEREAYLNKRDGKNPFINPYNTRAVSHENALKLEQARNEVLDFLRDVAKKGTVFFTLGFFQSLKLHFLPNSQVKEYFKDLTDDASFFRQAVLLAPNILSNASSEIRDNKEIILEAVSHRAEEIFYASSRLKVDKDIILAALQQNPNLSSEYLPEEGLDNLIQDHN